MLKKFCQEWDFNPRTHSCTRNLEWEVFFESGALDRSAILPYKVYCTVPFGLFAVVLPFWKVQIRNLFWHIVSNFWSFLFKVLNWSLNNHFCQCKKVPFTRCFNLSFVFSQGYVLNPSTLWYNKSFDRELSTRVLIPLNFQKQNCFWFCIVFNSWNTSQRLKSSDWSGIRTHAHIRVPEISSEKFSWDWRLRPLGHPALYVALYISVWVACCYFVILNGSNT